MKTRRKQTAVKGRFTAIFISAAVHVAVLIAAGTFVAVTVVQRQEARFEGRQVSRPRMQLQRLQVPQRARMERQAPQMSQRVTAQAIDSRSIEFQMPEIAGLGGGIQVDMSGAGFTGGLGFATPQINLFGLRSRGEKVVFILDTSRSMMVDEMGGVQAYEIIKQELLQMIGRLPPTTLLNVIVFEGRSGHQAFSADLFPATREKIDKLSQWLAPLNSKKQEIGLQTLAHPGVQLEFERMVPIPNIQEGYMVGISYAIQKGADSIYWLGTNDLINLICPNLYADAKRGRPIDPPSGLPPEMFEQDFSTFPGGEQRWRQLVAEARKMHEAENARRRAAGLPDRVLQDGTIDSRLVEAYFPGTELPRRGWERAYRFEERDILEYIQGMQRKHDSTDRRTARTGVRGGSRMSFNVIHFIPANEEPRPLQRLGGIPGRLNGQYLQIRGLEAIRSSAGSGG